MQKPFFLLLLLFTHLLSTTQLQRDGWNLIAVCQEIERADINMTNIIEIQAQDGQTIYTGEFASYSNLDKLEAGYGYWIKADAGTFFEGGVATTQLIQPFQRDGWNLMASCENITKADINMTGILEIQAQNGETLYTGVNESYSNLDALVSGYGYWVQGDKGTPWRAKEEPFTPTLTTRKTGQRLSYDKDGVEIVDGSQRDDGYYQKGVTPNFTRDDENDMVTDHLTGLMWQDNNDVSSVTKPWITQENYDAEDYNNTLGDTATTYCNELVLGGYEDWRLPTIKELEQLPNYSKEDSVLDAIFHYVTSYHVWSSSSIINANYTAWSVYFVDGRVGGNSKAYTLYVRCVRNK